MRTALSLCICLLLLGTAGTARAETNVCVLVRASSALSVKKQRKLQVDLERAVRRSRGVELVSHRDFLAAARDSGHPTGDWLMQPALEEIAGASSVDLVVAVSISEDGRKLELVAIDAMTGTTVGRQRLRLRKARVARRSVGRWAKAQRRTRARERRSGRDRQAFEEGFEEESEESPEEEREPEGPTLEEEATESSDSDESDGAGDDDAAESGEDDFGSVDFGDGGESEGESSESSGDDGFGGFSDSGFSDIDDSAPAVTSEVSTGGSALPRGLTLRGRAKIEQFTYFQAMEGRTAARNAAEFALSAKASEKYLTAAGTFLVRQDLSDDDRARIEAEEAYVEVHFSPLTLRAGRFIVAWGRASLSNPVDIINPIDARDPLAREKLPTYMLRSDLSLGNATLEAYILPVPEANQIPYFDGVDEQGQLMISSRWLPGGLLPADTRFVIGDSAPPAASAGNIQYAVRGTVSALGFDFAVGYARLFDRSPVLRLDQAQDTNGPLASLRLEYLPLNLFTLEAERAFGKLRLAGESLVMLTTNFSGEPDPAVESSTITTVFGGDWRTDEFADNQFVQFFLEYQLTRGIKRPLNRDAGGRLRRPFLDLVLGRVLYQASENFSAFVDTAVAPMDSNFMVRPGLRYIAFDRLTFEVKALFLTGDRDGFYGQFNANSRIQTSAEIKF